MPGTSNGILGIAKLGMECYSLNVLRFFCTRKALNHVIVFGDGDRRQFIITRVAVTMPPQFSVIASDPRFPVH